MVSEIDARCSGRRVHLQREFTSMLFESLDIPELFARGLLVKPALEVVHIADDNRSALGEN